MKTRLVLVGFCLLMLSLFVFSLYIGETSENQFVVFVQAVLLLTTPFLFLSSLVMLAFSLFRVQVLPDGRLAYDPRNPYWRAMKRIWKEEWPENISVCQACWRTAFCIFGLVVTITLLSLLTLLYFQGGLSVSKLTQIFIVSIPIFTFLGPLIAGERLQKIGRDRGYKVVEVLGRDILIALMCFWLIVAPFYYWVSFENLGLFSAVIAYLKRIGIVIGVVGLLAISPALFIFFFEETLLGQQIKAWKNNFCPTLNPIKTENRKI